MQSLLINNLFSIFFPTFVFLILFSFIFPSLSTLSTGQLVYIAGVSGGGVGPSGFLGNDFPFLFFVVAYQIIPIATITTIIQNNVIWKIKS